MFGDCIMQKLLKLGQNKIPEREKGRTNVSRACREWFLWQDSKFLDVLSSFHSLLILTISLGTNYGDHSHLSPTRHTYFAIFLLKISNIISVVVLGFYKRHASSGSFYFVPKGRITKPDYLSKVRKGKKKIYKNLLKRFLLTVKNGRYTLNK